MIDKHKIINKMEVAKELKVIMKEDKENLRDEISTLKKRMSDYKVERKSSWKSFKKQFKDDFDKIEKSLEKLKIHHKK